MTATPDEPAEEPLRMAIVYDAVYPYVKGGAERRYYELARRLADRGHDVHWYGMRYWDGPAVQRIDGVTYHGVCRPRPLYTAGGRRSITQALIFGLACLRLLFDRYDVVDCCGFPYFSLFSARLAVTVRGGTLVSTWHEVWGRRYWRHYLGRLGVVGHVVELVAARLPRHVLAVSHTTAGRLHDDLRRDSDVLPNGVDVATVQGRTGPHADAPEAVPPTDEDGFGQPVPAPGDSDHDVPGAGTARTDQTDHAADIVYAGRLVDFKDVEMLLRALPAVLAEKPDLTCSIIGDGPHRPVLEELAATLGVDDAVRFSGFLADEHSVYTAMRQSGVFVLPSKREGFGIVVLEANAAGLPVVVVDHADSSADELISGLNGVVVPPDPATLASTLVILLEGASDGQREVCRRSAADHDWHEVALGYEHSLQEVRS